MIALYVLITHLKKIHKRYAFGDEDADVRRKDPLTRMQTFTRALVVLKVEFALQEYHE